MKAADSILKKFPNHGETLAMKGLILSCLERKHDAYDYVRKGIKANITSHVCMFRMNIWMNLNNS